MKRLSRALETEIPTTTTIAKPPYPSRRSRAFTLPDNDISILDFLKLDRCKLGNIIANKNSSLGRVAQPSQKLFNLLDFLAHAPSCIQYLQDNKQESLAHKLKTALTIKQNHLNTSLWLATVGSIEYEIFWQPPYDLGNYPNHSNLHTITALQTINGFVNSTKNKHYLFSHTEKQQIETALSHLHSQEGGYLLKSYILLQEKLQQANAMLQTAIDRPFCSKGKHNQQIPIVQNVIKLFFLQDVQVWAAQLNQRYYAIQSDITKLEVSLNNYGTDSFKQWQIARNQIIEKTSTEIITHTQRIKSLYKQCNINIRN